jgi:hypothetical protein
VTDTCVEASQHERNNIVIVMASQDLENAMDQRHSFDDRHTQSRIKDDTLTTSATHSSSSSITTTPPRPSRTTSLARGNALSRTVSEVRDGILNQRELGDGEDNVAPDTKPEHDDEDEDRDENLVTWDGPDDPSNPKSWPIKRKWLAVITGRSILPSLPLSYHYFDGYLAAFLVHYLVHSPHH